MLTSKLELLVEGGTDGRGEAFEKTLEQLRSVEGFHTVEVKNGAMIVETSLPSSVVLATVEKMTGSRTVLQGFGDRSSAVVQLSGAAGVVGVVRLQQASGGRLVVDGTIDGLAPGPHALRVHVAGDLSQGCESLGEVYGGADGPGQLGRVVADSDGRAAFLVIHDPLEISEIIGRSLAVSGGASELSKTSQDVDWNKVKNVGCGVIARSAGVFANPKRVCACDGVVVWDERERPAAGVGRRDPPAAAGQVKPCCRGKHSNL